MDNRDIDSTEEEIPEDVTLEELREDQHRKISEKDRHDSEEYLEKSGLDSDAKEHI
jgi:hypothetical protein